MLIDSSSHVFKILKICSQTINPAFLIALIIGLALLRRQDKTRFWGILMASVISIAITYLIKNVEGHNDIWANWGMNFSSHSALAIACCTAMAFIWQKRWWVFVTIFVVYAIFMIMMQFHTVPDILSTTAVIFAVCWVCQFMAWRRNRAMRAE